MKIGIDARFLGPEGTGIGRYVEKLVTNLEKIDTTNEYFILLRKKNFPLYKPKSKNFRKVLADASWYSFKEQFLLPKIISDIKPDLMHFPHYNIPLLTPSKFVVTLYDLTKWEFGKEASNVENPLIFWLKQSLYKMVVRKAVSGATKIISGSDTTKEKLINLLGVTEDKIKTIYAGANDFLNAEADISQKMKIFDSFGINKPYILYVGNAAPYKNVSLVISALKDLKTFQFVYVSSRDNFAQNLHNQAIKIGVEDRLVITGFVPDKDLVVLYQEAECYVFPSLSEGFGLPALEAMGSSCPVVCSDIKVLREVCGEAALYFNPKSEADLIEKITKLTNDRVFKKELIKKGLQQVRKYSWERLARETLAVYEQAGAK